MRGLRTAVRPAWLLACASAAAMLGGGAAQGADVFGSSGIITNRYCAADATTCTTILPDGSATLGPRLQANQVFGGYGSAFSASSTLLNGAAGAAATSFGDGYLPTVKVGSSAGAETRTGASASAFQSFTYNGDVAIDLAINGLLHFVNSGDAAGPAPNNDYAGDGTLNVVLSLLSVGKVAAAYGPGSTAGDLISNNDVNFATCGDSGVVAVSEYNTNGGAAGEHTATLGLSSRCGGGAITLNPGDSFVVVATLQAISNRSGFVDAMHTFTVQYDEAHTYLAGTTESVGEGFLAQNVAPGAPVPEPATWALMIGGFGLAGAAARRRRPARVRATRR